ncbi:uncharacterized protein LOC112035818 [Quercus suber]|uniref:uncharacterized protein LOC112035818 n=1 Tax=Quercus suber TaxID=58331 RepID=UPI0032DEBE85
MDELGWSDPPPPAAAPPASAVAPPPAAAVTRPFATAIPAPAPVISARPIFSTSSVPSSPVQRVSAPAAPVVSQPQTRVSAPSSSVQTSPVTKAVPSSSSVRTSPIAREAPTQSFPDVKAATTRYDTTTITTAPSPKTIKPAAQTPPQSPKPKPTAPPPSPLNLPPTRLKAETETEQKIPLEAEQKTVLVQKTIEKPKPWLGGNADSQWEHSEHYKPSYVHSGKQEGHKEVEIQEKGSYKKLSDSEEGGTRVITIAGENKGAFMELIRSPKKLDGSEKSKSLQVKKGITTTGIQGSDSESYSSSDKEGNPKKDKSHKGTNSVPMSAFMNSNVQGINNSIVYNSSYNHHDPGVHLTLSRKASGRFQAKERVNGDRD